VPTYQYACTECGEDLEAVQKFSDDPLTVCPACGGKLRKVFSPVGIVFKGSGFYRNDSRVSSSTNTKDKALNGSSTDSSSSSSSGEKSAGTDQKTSASSSSSSEPKPGKTSSSSEKSTSTSSGTKVA
jgi:putative FmdB family regulatory protein